MRLSKWQETGKLPSSLTVISLRLRVSAVN